MDAEAGGGSQGVCEGERCTCCSAQAGRAAAFPGRVEEQGGKEALDQERSYT